MLPIILARKRQLPRSGQRGARRSPSRPMSRSPPMYKSCSSRPSGPSAGDILVNNAGVYRFEPIEAVTEEEFHRIYNTNVLGALLTMQEAIKRFGPDGGTIINIATAGISTTAPMSSVYTSSKSALVTLSHVLAKELGPRNIRVNVVAPGATETEGAHAIGVLEGPMVKQLVDGTPLGRLGQPEDIVGPVVFLASSDAHWVTGEVLFASGGSR
jgi:3-oxoacyl-[acyl-carrier protein] reductase